MSSSNGTGITNGVKFEYKIEKHGENKVEYTWHLFRPLESKANDLVSTTFWLAGSEWCLQVYPNGWRSESEDFIGAFLICQSRHHHQVFYSFTAMSLCGNRMCMGEPAAFTDKALRWGFTRFLHRQVVFDPCVKYYENSTLRLLITIRIQDPWRELLGNLEQLSVQRPAWQTLSPETTQCIYCLSAPQTSGFLHSGKSHKCVCEGCAKELGKQQNLMCPICREPVEKIIYQYF